MTLKKSFCMVIIQFSWDSSVSFGLNLGGDLEKLGNSGDTEDGETLFGHCLESHRTQLLSW